MDLSTALASLRRNWVFPVIGLLAAAAVSAIMLRNADPLYAASATYLVAPSPTDPDVIENIKTLDATRSRTILTTLTEIMTSDTVVNEAATAAGVDPAAYRVDAATLPEANGVTLRVVGPDPLGAPALAGAVATVSAGRFLALYRIYEVASLDPPVSPAPQSGRSLPEALALGGFVGLASGGAVSLLRGPGIPRRKTVSGRLGAYGGNVTPLRDRERISRAG